MCGLVAFFSNSSIPEQSVVNALEHLAPRGPDDYGIWRADGVVLGHRRLAIIDLDHSAGQPMFSSCERYVMVYNGEIYNYKELRESLLKKGYNFHTKSDSEVILNMFIDEGENMLHKLFGMFSFVIWDRKLREAFIARDPYGIKPLYIGDSKGILIVASQVKTILSTQLVSREPNLYGQAGFWMLGYVVEPNTWFREINAVKAGHFIKIKDSRIIETKKWIEIAEAWQNSNSLKTISKEELFSNIREKLYDSVTRHLVSDVPVGLFLSGGIDSGAIAGIISQKVNYSLTGITLTYDEYEGKHENEAPVAAKLARYYGINHHVRSISKEEFQNDLPKIFASMDQPSIDGVNTWYVSKTAAELGIKVVLSGVGGDELFFGYRSFKYLTKLVSIWSRASCIPGFLFIAENLARYQSIKTRNKRWLHSLLWLQSISGAWWLRRGLFSVLDLPEFIARDVAMEIINNFSAEEWVFSMSGEIPENSMLALAQIESMGYLRNQLLRDSDWASMAHSVELRTPLVDSKLLFELSPYFNMIKNYRRKIILANAPLKSLPNFVVNRPKTGFGIPLNGWLNENNNSFSKDFRYWAKILSKRIYELS